MYRLLAMFLLFACEDKTGANGSKSASDESVDGTALIGLTFLLDSADGYTPLGEGIRISFMDSTESELRFSFNAGCNTISGEFALENGTIKFDELYVTEMACETDLMDQDNWFVGFFQEEPQLEHNADALTLTGNAAVLHFIDSEVATPDQPLVDTEWTFDTFIEGDTMSTVNLGTSPTATFNSDGTINLHTGCSEGSVNYSINGNELTFSQGVITQMSCSDPNGDEVEQKITEAFSDGISTYAIDANRLTLMRGNNGVSGLSQ